VSCAWPRLHHLQGPDGDFLLLGNNAASLPFGVEPRYLIRTVFF
jgi:hypothetical protein